jgi:ribosomal protein S18 acetylase RimI-like enzyme
MTIEIADFSAADYDEAIALWKRCEGVGLSDADEREPLTAFLMKNPGLNFIARENGTVVGTCLSGSDGRRGYLYHLAVDPAQRRKGIGRILAQKTLHALALQGIQKCHIMVFGANELGLTFWKNEGWITRPEIVLMSHNVGCEERGGPC